MANPQASNLEPGGAGEKPRCGLCGKTEKLTRTPCCGNWICDDADHYVPFSYERNSCFRNHTLFTICGFHGSAKHEGRWQDCAPCRENQPRELFVECATNDYNFEKLENPPTFEPTRCAGCGQVVRLAEGGYTMQDGGCFCKACVQTPSREILDSFRPRRRRHEGSLADVPMSISGQRGTYPMGSVMLYGPDNTLATKLVATITKTRDAPSDLLHRWITHAGDIRRDAAIQAEVQAFFERQAVRQTIRTERIIGCPHEEGKDYPSGGICPHCPFWHNRDRFTHELLTSEEPDWSEPMPFRAPPRICRNDPCPCGSGKKYKKCCGAN